MTSPRQILADITDLGLDPTKAYMYTDDSGRISKTDDVAETPLDIMGQAGLIGWWRADSSTGNPVSAAADKSGNGGAATQATPAQRPALVTGVLGLPAWSVIRANKQGLQALVTIASGSRPGGFIIAASTGSHDTAAHATITAHGDPAAAGWQEGTEPFTGHTGWLAFGTCVDGATGILESVAPADAAVHLFSFLFDPAGARFGVDGVDVISAKTGALLNTCDYTSIGSTDPIVGDSNGWDGLIYERFITVAQPTASQLARLKHYVRARYKIAIS
jgi:hypothetical protein